MIKRVISTVALWTIVLGLIYLFKVTAALWLIAFFAVATQYELYVLLGKMGYRPFTKVGCLFGALIILGPFYLDRLETILPDYLSGRFDPASMPGNILAGAAIVFAIRILRERDSETRTAALASSLFGLLYVPFMLQFFIRMILGYQSPDDGHIELDGMFLCLWLVAVAKFCDVGALLTGLLFGKHKMAPEISPKKTWEGAIGGVLISMGVGAGIAWLYANYLPDDTPEGLTPLIGAIIALPVSLVAIVSDLIESVIKRRADIKDTGSIIPGIGGVFDLTDSLILAAPVGYCLFLFLL